MSDRSILPVVRYADPATAADWLCRAYGFSIHHIAKRPDGGTAYIVARFGESLVLVGAQASSDFDDLMVQPSDVGNRSTQTCYLTVKDVEQHFADAQAAGARIEVELRDDGDGGRFYMSRDLEGHLWSFGDPLDGATLARPDRPSATPRGFIARGGHAAVGLAMLVVLAGSGSAALYLGADLAPKALAAWIGSLKGPDAAAGQLERERPITVATKRPAEAEAAAVGTTEELQISQLQFTEAPQQKQSAEKLLSASEAEYQNRLKETQDVLAAALRAKEAAFQELEAERLRAQVIQQQLNDASEKLANQRTDGNKGDADALQLRAAIAQLSDALLSSTQAVEVARGQLAAVQNTETGLREKLRASAREAADLRARLSELEAEKEASRSRTHQDAVDARTALAAARAKQAARLKAGPPTEATRTALAAAAAKEAARLKAEQSADATRTAHAAAEAKEAARMKAEQAADATRTAHAAAAAKEAARLKAEQAADATRTAHAAAAATEAARLKAEQAAEATRTAHAAAAAKEAARLKAEQAAESIRTAHATAEANEATPRDKVGAPAIGPLPQHHLTQGKKWIAVAAIDKKGELPSPEAPKVLDSGTQSPCRDAVRDLAFLRRATEATQSRVLTRLCDGAHATQEPAKCLSRLMSEKAYWGGGTNWDLKHAVDLCARTPSAKATLSCFLRRISAKASRDSAIASCSAT